MPVAGFSLGALVGLELAVAHPGAVRSVVGIGAHSTPDAKTRAALQGLDPERLARADPDWAADLARHHDSHHAPGHWRDLLRGIAAAVAAARSYTAEDLGRIAAPTLWIAGENDTWCELDQPLTMKRRIPGAELLLVNHAEHDVQMTHPHLIGPVLMDFLSRHDGPPGP